MKFKGLQVDDKNGNVILTMERETAEDFMQDGEFNPSLSKVFKIPLFKGDKDKLVNAVGKNLADAIEAQYWNKK